MEGGPKPRFGHVSDETLLQLITQAGNENTARATSSWLRVVSDDRSQKGPTISFVCSSAEELATVLEKVYAEVRPKKGCEYSRSSNLAARAAVQRHLRVLKRSCNTFTETRRSHSQRKVKSVVLTLPRES